MRILPAGRGYRPAFGTSPLPVTEQSGHEGAATAIGVEQPRSPRLTTVGEDLHSVSDAHLSAGADSLGMRG